MEFVSVQYVDAWSNGDKGVCSKGGEPAKYAEL